MEFTEELITQWTPLIHKVIGKFYNANTKDALWRISKDDLFQESAIILNNCCKHWNNKGKASFETYLYGALANGINKYIKENSKSFRVNQKFSKLIYSVNKEYNNNPQLSLEQLAKKMSVKEYDIIDALAAASPSISIDALRSNGDRGIDIEDTTLFGSEKFCQSFIYTSNQSADFLKEVIESLELTDEEKKIYCMSNGILGYQKKTREEIAAQIGKSIKTITRSNQRVTELLKNSINKDMYTAYIS